METIIKYEFIVIPDDGSQPMTWGYRKKKKAARKRLRELKEHFENRIEGRCKVEVLKVVSIETRHIANLEEE